MACRPYEYRFADAYQVCIPGHVHGLDPAHMVIEIRGSTLTGRLTPSRLVHGGTGDVTITFFVPQSGVIVLHAISPSEVPLSP
jgi:hypothetical protein